MEEDQPIKKINGTTPKQNGFEKKKFDFSEGTIN